MVSDNGNGSYAPSMVNMRNLGDLHFYVAQHATCQNSPVQD